MPTLYRDGTIALPQFYGIEAVDSSSDNTNVTSGATRTYEFVSQIGPVDIITHEPVSGSVFTMTGVSQSQCSHEITSSDSTRDHTLTLTLYKTKALAPFGMPGQNCNPKRDILMGKDSDYCAPKSGRTDSIVNGIYPQAFSSYRHEIVLKKTMYYLTDFPNY